MMNAIESRRIMNEILLRTTDKYFDVYLGDNSKIHLSIAEANLNAAYKRGAFVNPQLNRLFDICYVLDNE